MKIEPPGINVLDNGKNTNGLLVFGSLKINSVKITSWNQSTRDYAKNPGNRDLCENRVEKGSPRPFISVESDAVGTTDITNSELAYLGYEGGVNGGPVVGITYFGGAGSIIKNNDIHNLYFGFYSNGVGKVVVPMSFVASHTSVLCQMEWILLELKMKLNECTIIMKLDTKTK